MQLTGLRVALIVLHGSSIDRLTQNDDSQKIIAQTSSKNYFRVEKTLDGGNSVLVIGF